MTETQISLRSEVDNQQRICPKCFAKDRELYLNIGARNVRLSQFAKGDISSETLTRLLADLKDIASILNLDFEGCLIKAQTRNEHEI